ncbi:MAG: hypothetical protein R6U50_02335 [Desulfobacterales bacterium]
MAISAKSKNIFVVGLDDHNLGELKTIHHADRFTFHKLLDVEEVTKSGHYDMEAMFRKAADELDAFDGSIDAIIGFWDFPVSLMVPLLSERFGTVGPTLESALKCEHKYWSRLEQTKWLGHHVPAVSPVNPFADDPFSTVDVAFPFWLKPVKAHSSWLGFRIENREQFNCAIEDIRDKIGRFAEPFNFFLSQIELPAEVAEVDGHWCVAEEILSGDQCTLSGYVFGGDIHSYGLVDSLYYSEFHSFLRYRYPSEQPEELKLRMAEISTNIMARIGFDNSPFNIEFLYDRDRDTTKLLEINTRISQSHADLYAKVEGASNHQVLVDIATGQKPEIPRGRGRYRTASKLQHRVFTNGTVIRVPDEAQIKKVRETFPGTIVLVEVEPGQRLSELENQDAYSYRLAVIYMGAEDDETLMENYRQCIDMLDFEIDEAES